MTPYGGLTFFYILILLLIPAAVLGMAGRSLRHYGALVTLALLLVIFDTWRARALLAAFWLWQLLLALFCQRLQRQQNCCSFWIWILALLALAPMLAVKMCALLPGISLSLLGISYMTFRSLGVLLDLWDRRIERVHPYDFTCFVLFAPAVSSGPLDRYRRFSADFRTVPQDYPALLRDGVWQLMTGALYYFVFGNLIWTCWLEALPAGGFAGWAGYFYGYTFFMFFNFAGYSRMAVGTAYLLGIRMPGNFNRPFLSVDMKEFWSRWHMSLSTWLRDYVYNRFCIAALRGKWFRQRHTSSYLGNLLTMTLMGVWHGLTPGYLVYGLYHGCVLCCNDVLDTRWKRFKKLKKQPVPRVLMGILTFHLFAFGLLLFSGKLIG